MYNSIQIIIQMNIANNTIIANLTKPALLS